jgi:hypothetical protein
VNISVSIVEDLLAVGIALAALMLPAAAILVGGGLVALLLLVGPVLWRAAALGMRALAARIRGFFGLRGWRGRAELPRRLRPLVGPQPEGRRPPVTARAGLTGLRGLGAYRNGWVVFDDDRRVFVYHGFLRPRRLDLDAPATVRIQPGVLADRLDVHNGTGAYQLLLLKDGPGAERVAAELQAAR